jgi:hypothetical protein
VPQGHSLGLAAAGGMVLPEDYREYLPAGGSELQKHHGDCGRGQARARLLEFGFG